MVLKTGLFNVIACNILLSAFKMKKALGGGNRPTNEQIQPQIHREDRL